MGEIEVKNLENADVEVVNHSPLTMIGKGRQGAVFQISDEVCVKVFGNTEDCEREHYALTLGQHTNLFPEVYEKGPLYIAMEIIKGVDLREYLQSHPLTEELSMKLINMLITFKEIGYDRIDHHKRQIYLQPDGNLKVIDVARTVWRDRVYPYPRKLLTSFGEEYKELFLSHVQALSPELYEEWKHYIRMEELSRQIYQVILKNPSNKDKLEELSNKLLTTNDEQIYVTQLESLVHKVFKEEWVKTMLARGTDPEVVMEKIDKRLEKWEKCITQLENLGQKVFKEEWVKTILARETDPEVVMEKIDKHLEKWEKCITQLEGLGQKVFKEEWVKTILARETDPEVVMEKIDKHLEKPKKNNVPNEDNQRKNKQEDDHDSQNNNKSANKGSYIGYNENNKSNLKEGNKRNQKFESFPSNNRNTDNDKFKNWFNLNESSIKPKRQK
jgi:hypothetical protein